MTRLAPPIKWKPFYGWFIVAVGMIVLAVESGAGFYSFGIFFKPLMNDFGWSRGQVSAAVTLYYLSNIAAGIAAGRLCDARGPKIAILLGAAITGAAFFLLASTQSLWQLYAQFVLLAVGMLFMALIPISSLISAWFEKRRSLVAGITMTGYGFGGLLIAPLSSWLISDFGWRAAFLVLGLIPLVVILPLAAMVVRSKPSDLGELPYGSSRHSDLPADRQAMEATPAIVSMSPSAAVHSRAFWALVISFILNTMGSGGVVLHQFPYFTDQGFSPALAAASLSLSGLSSIIGKLCFGHLGDRFGARYSLAVSVLLQATALVIAVSIHHVVALLVFVVLFGMGFGGTPPLRAVLILEFFGPAAFGRIFGAVVGITAVGSAIGPLLSGFIFDMSGSHTVAFVTYIVTYTIAAGVVLCTRPPQPLHVPF